jgi:hypothetical protein
VRQQGGDTALWRQHKQQLSVARAAQWRQKTLRLLALPHPCLQQMMEGEELYTRVQKKVAPDASPGWTMVLRDRATRLLWDRRGGRKDRQLWKKALRRLCQGSQPTGALTLLTAGERRSGSRWLELCREARRTGKRGRPTKTRRTGVKVRRKHTGAQRHQRGRPRPKSPAPSPEPPDTAPPLATPETAMHANPREAFHTSLRRRGAASRRRTNRYAKNTGRLQERWDVYGMVPNFVRVPLTTRPVPAVAFGVLESGLSLHEIFFLQKVA